MPLDAASQPESEPGVSAPPLDSVNILARTDKLERAVEFTQKNIDSVTSTNSFILFFNTFFRG